MPICSASVRASLWARTLKPMTAAFEASAERDVGFGDAADTGMNDARGDLFGVELLERGDDRLDRALDVALDEQREFLAPRRFELAHHIGERTARHAAARGDLVALLTLAIFGDFAGARFAFDDRDAVAGLRRAGEAEHLDRHRRTGTRGVSRPYRR